MLVLGLVMFKAVRVLLVSPTSTMDSSLTTSYVSTPTISAAGSMVTAFTPPDYCTNVIKSSCTFTTPYSYYSSGSSRSYGDPYTSCAYVERDLTCGSDGRATRASACFPDDADPTGTLIFSPGIGCPAGWKTESEIVMSSKTTAVCCPSGYQPHTSYASCIMTISYTDDTTTALSCYSGGSLVRDTLTYYTSSYSSYTSSYPEYSSVWAQRIQVVLATTSAGDVTFGPFSEPTSSDGFNGPSNPPIPQPKRKSGLVTGAIVGIVVGVVGALFLVGAFIFWRRRQQKHHHAPILKANPAGEHDALPEFVGGNGTTTSPTQMTTATSNGLFQPQPELRSPR